MTAAAANHEDDSPNFMVGTLDALARGTDDPVQAAQLRALAHLAKTSDKTERRLGTMEKAVARLEGLEGKNSEQEKRIAKLESEIQQHKASVKGAWWAASLIAGGIIIVIGAAWAVFDRFYEPSRKDPVVIKSTP